MPTAEETTLRCAVHPSLPAADTCPVCERARCAADSALAPGGGCLACEGRRGRPGPPPVDLRSMVKAGIVGNLVVVPTGYVASQYVDAGWVGWVVPAFVAIIVSIAAEHAAGPRRGTALRGLAAAYSVLAVFVAFSDERASATPFTGKAALQYAIAGVVAWLWTAPPRVVARAETSEG